MRIVRPKLDRVPETTLEAERRYRERELAQSYTRDAWATRARRWSWGRMASFVVALGSLVAWITWNGQMEWLWAAATALLLFLFAVFRHLHARTCQTRAERLVTLNREAVHRLYRHWDEVRPPPATVAVPDEMRDLHIAGRGSVLHWLGTVATPPGRRLLLRWLAETEDPASLVERQDAVRALAPALDERQRFMAEAEYLREQRDDDEALLRWAGQADTPAPPRMLVNGLALATLATFVADLAGVLQLRLWIPLVLVNVLLTVRYWTPLALDAKWTERGSDRLVCYAQLLALIGNASTPSPLLLRLKERLGCTAATTGDTGNAPAWQRIHALARWVALFQLRRFGLYYLLAQPLLLWDFHCQHALRAWRRRHGAHIAQWLDAIATYEVLASAASVHHDHPDWGFAQARPGTLAIDAGALGHPLIADRDRVCNDLRIGPETRLLLLGGSNMSGKSTLLRALGCNLVLARCGAPVCARHLHYPPLAILTSFHVEDSLTDGVSLFMAELLRIKQALDEAAHHTAAGRPCLFLLDEILHGTNSHERRTAVTWILQRLLALDTLGAISTHDRELVRELQASGTGQARHFREVIAQEDGQTVMRFDYRLREGPAESGNALGLLQAAGIVQPPPSSA